jgi:preprotein translocase subunit SecA
MEEGQDIQHPLVTQAIRTAQKRVETQNFEIRKHLLKYDNVMNQQRELIYSRRYDAISQESLRQEIFDILETILEDWLANRENTEEYLSECCRKLRFKFLLSFTTQDFLDIPKDEITRKISELAQSHYAKKENMLGGEKTRYIEKMITLGVIDSNWKDYLFGVDQLREGIMWRSYGQKDPLVEYQHEAFAMFSDLMKTIDEEIVERIFKTFAIEEKFAQGIFKQEKESFIHEEYSALQAQGDRETRGPSIPMPMPDTRSSKDVTYKRSAPKVGRNDPCPCGSGLKYKKCCGKSN